MKVGFPSGERTIDVDSPWGKENIRRIARRSYSALSSSLVSSPRSANQVIAEIAIIIRKEMKQICSESHDSVIRDSQEGIKHFKWERVWTELVNHMPTLMKLLSAIFLNQKATQNIMLSHCMHDSEEEVREDVYGPEGTFSSVIWEWL